MELTAEGLRKAHGRLGSPDEIVHQRRILYSAAIDLSTESEEHPHTSDEILDNPAVRGHLGAVLSGRAQYAANELRPLGELVAPGFSTEVGGRPVRVASSSTAPSALAGALSRIDGELKRHGDENGGLDLLTVGHRVDIETAYQHVVDGVRLAVRVAPELALDLLPHVSLFAVVVADETARLGSASAREYPGLILIPAPRSALEVAEALLHEGAHQKFFDLGMTRAMLVASSPDAPRFSPSWAPAGAPEWPLEQSVAAWHAYHCLAVFARCLAGFPELQPWHDDSLLPKAADRAAEIGRFVREQGSFLGADAHTLIAAFEGAPPAAPWPVEEDGVDIASAAHDESIVVRSAGNRTLLARRGTPPDLYWLESGLVRN